MSELISDSAIKRSTGVSWTTWLERLNQMGAQDLSHKEIATRLVSDYQIAGWWAQSLTVRYEQSIGRRRPGQNNAGDFSVSVSKTLAGSLDEGLDWWLQKIHSRTEFNSTPIVTSSTTKTEKWRNYRLVLEDGSRVAVGIYAKTPAKASFSLQHDKLPTSEAAEAWRMYWKALISDS